MVSWASWGLGGTLCSCEEIFKSVRTLRKLQDISSLKKGALDGNRWKSFHVHLICDVLLTLLFTILEGVASANLTTNWSESRTSGGRYSAELGSTVLSSMHTLRSRTHRWAYCIMLRFLEMCWVCSAKCRTFACESGRCLAASQRARGSYTGHRRCPPTARKCSFRSFGKFILMTQKENRTAGCMASCRSQYWLSHAMLVVPIHCSACCSKVHDVNA